jgi:hypothetical protein
MKISAAKFRCGRPAIARMHTIAARLRRSRPFTVSDVARELECNRKTIARDIAFMRNRLGWEIEWNWAVMSYKLIAAPRAVL